MTRSRRSNDYGFNWATIFQVGFIPVVTAAIVVSGFYYITQDTLARHNKEIEALTTKAQAEAVARQAVRDEYLLSQQKINENLGKLDTRLAVSETKQETANQTLSRIADELVKLTSATVRTR